MLTVIERRFKIMLNSSESRKKWKGKHILQNKTFVVTEEEEREGINDGRFYV